MPEKRFFLKDTKEAISAGELNYLFTGIATDYLERMGKTYQTINDVMGALEGCKLEFYRRIVAPYEDTKIIENGDVYPVG